MATTFFKNISSAVTTAFIDVPEYKVEKEEKEKDFEVRSYPETIWVSTKIQGMNHGDAASAGFKKLFNYIQGKNEGGVKIAMTAPVVNRVEPGPGPNCESNFTVSFFMAKEQRENPPKPKDPDVFIETWPATKVISRRFGGFYDDKKWMETAKSLAEAMGPEYSDKIHQEFHFTVGYDSPFKLFNRRNELWFIMKED